MNVECRAAWVPFGGGALEGPAALAVAWVEGECAAQGRSGLVVTPRATIKDYVDDIRNFAARHEYTSARSGRDRRAGGTGPVIAYLLDIEGFEFAADRARGSSLCAVEFPTFRLSGWAASRGAVNLVTGEEPAPLGDEVTALLQHLVFAGNNGWFDAPGKRDALKVLGELHELAPALDAAFLAGYVLGEGKSARAAKQLHTLAGVGRR